MLRHVPIAALACTLLLALSCAGSQAPQSARQADVLRVVTPGDYAPFATCSDTPPPVCNGFDVELVESFATGRGMSISWTRSTWSLLSEDLQTHDMAIGGITVRDERSRLGPFSEAIVHTGKQALMRCLDREHFPTWDAFERGARVVANLGGGNERFAKAHFAPDSVLILTTNDEVPAALLAGDADVFFTDGPEASLLARTHESLCIGLEGKLHEPFDLALWFNPAASELRDDFDRYLRSKAGSKRLQELRSQYALP